MRKPHVVVLIMAVVLAHLFGGVARADEGMLPPAVNASRLEELLDRAGYRNLPVDTRRVIRDLHAEYAVEFATIRDSRTEAWLADVDALFSLSRAPSEKEVRRLLNEHGALVERAAVLDRELFARVLAVLPAADGFDPPADLTIASGLREVDRLAASMPLQLAVGTRGDLYEFSRHLDVAADRKAAVLATIAERDRALPGRVREVWLTSRQLLIAAARGFDEVFDGVLPQLGAALDRQEAERKKEEIVRRASREIERVERARRGVRDLDDRTIAAIAAQVEPSERRELLLRVAFRSGATGTSAASTEAAFRAARRFLQTDPAVLSEVDAADARWGQAFESAVGDRLRARDLEQDRELTRESSLGGLRLDFSGVVDLPGDPILIAASDAARELGAILEPLRERLNEGDLAIVMDEETDEGGVKRAIPRATSKAWGRLYVAAIREASPADRSGRRPSLGSTDHAGVALWWSPTFVEEAVLSSFDSERRDAARAIIADASEIYAARVSSPVAKAKEDWRTAQTPGGEIETRRQQACNAVRLRNEAFFANELVDRESMASLRAIATTDAERASIDRAAFEREFDRELLAIDLSLRATANPWTALRVAQLSPEARVKGNAVLSDSMRWMLPDVRRSRAAAFAVSEIGEQEVFDGALTFDLRDERRMTVYRARYEADRECEKSFARLLAAISEALAAEATAFQRAYAAAAMRESDDHRSAAAPTLARIGRLPLDEDRRSEIASLVRAHATEREALVLERAMVDSGFGKGPRRGDEIERLSQLIRACDDRLETAALGLLTPAERSAVRGADALDRLLDGRIEELPASTP